MKTKKTYSRSRACAQVKQAELIINKVDNFFIENPYEKGLYLILTRYFIKNELSELLDVDKKEITKNISILLKEKGIL